MLTDAHPSTITRSLNFGGVSAKALVDFTGREATYIFAIIGYDDAMWPRGTFAALT